LYFYRTGIARAKPTRKEISMSMLLRFLFVIAIFSAPVAFGATTAAAAEGFFTKGHIEGGIHPPHNEIEMNLRRADLPETRGFGDNFGRYAVRGEVFVGYKFQEDGFVRSVFVVAKPYAVFGRTIPQTKYTWSARPIGYARHYGFGVELPSGWVVYAESHKWTFFDKEARPNDGPFGQNNGVYVRKNFDVSF
jgi:hypothetical protein